MTPKCKGCHSVNHNFENCPTSWDKENYNLQSGHPSKDEVKDPVVSGDWGVILEEQEVVAPVEEASPTPSAVSTDNISCGLLVIDESLNFEDTDSPSLKRPRDTDEASFITVLSRSFVNKKIGDNVT